MQVVAALLTLVFSVLVARAGYDAEGASFAIGVFGIVAGFALLLSARVGLVLLALPIILAIAGTINIEGSYAVYVVAYGLFAFMAWRIARGKAERRRERQLAAERAERMDRYVRQQLGEADEVSRHSP